MKKLNYIFILAILFFAKNVLAYNQCNYGANVVATIIDGERSFAVISTNEESKWKISVKVGDRFRDGEIVRISYQTVWIKVYSQFCFVGRKPFSDKYLNWDKTKNVTEMLYDFSFYNFLLGNVDNDIENMVLDGGKSVNPELWSYLINRKREIYDEMIGLLK